MEPMNRRGILLLAILGAAISTGAVAQELSAVRSVYLLPMSSGLDQYLANHLTANGVFQVVTDPQRADAILTSEIGPVFEQRLDELYPPAPTEEAPAESQTEAAGSEVSLLDTGRPLVSSFSRGKGNVFLVGRESRRVLWSFYHLPRDSSSKQLNNAADKIVSELRKSLGQ